MVPTRVRLLRHTGVQTMRLQLHLMMAAYHARGQTG